MKKLTRIIFLTLILPNVGFPQETQTGAALEGFTYNLNDLEDAHLLSGKLIADDRIMVVVLDYAYFESTVHVLQFDLAGNLILQSKLQMPDALSIQCLMPGNEIYVSWTQGGISDPGQFWLAKMEGDQWDRKKYLEIPDELLGRWWLLEVGGQKKLFIVRQTSQMIKYNEQDFDFIHSYWLYGYQLQEEGIILENRIPIDSDDYHPRNLECTVMGDQVCIWNTYSERFSPVETLRAALWNKEGKLDWTDCYVGNRPLSFKVDPDEGSAVSVYEAKNPSNLNAAGILSLVGTERTIPITLPYQYEQGNGDLLHPDQGPYSWLITTPDFSQEQIVLIAFDQQLRPHSYAVPAPLDVRYAQLDIRENEVWMILMYNTYNAQARTMLKVQKFIPAEALPLSADEEVKAMSVFGVDPDELESYYNSYINNDGKELVKATNEQLAESIVNSSDTTALINYHRLLLRDESQAEASLARKVLSACTEGAKREGWLVQMQLGMLGEPSYKHLLRIAQADTVEQRKVAVRGLCGCGDPALINEMFKLLEDTEIDIDNSTYIGLCQTGLRVGNPAGVDYLIRAATIVLNDQTPDPKSSLYFDTRDILKGFVRDYDDAPTGWSAPDWQNWWRKYRASWKPIEPTVAEKSYMERIKEMQEIYREVARKLENSGKVRDRQGWQESRR